MVKIFTSDAGQVLRSNGDKSVVKKLMLEFPNFQPLVPWMGMVLKYLDQKKFILSLI